MACVPSQPRYTCPPLNVQDCCSIVDALNLNRNDEEVLIRSVVEIVNKSQHKPSEYAAEFQQWKMMSSQPRTYEINVVVLKLTLVCVMSDCSLHGRRKQQMEQDYQRYLKTAGWNRYEVLMFKVYAECFHPDYQTKRDAAIVARTRIKGVVPVLAVMVPPIPQNTPLRSATPINLPTIPEEENSEDDDGDSSYDDHSNTTRYHQSTSSARTTKRKRRRHKLTLQRQRKKTKPTQPPPPPALPSRPVHQKYDSDTTSDTDDTSMQATEDNDQHTKTTTTSSSSSSFPSAAAAVAARVAEPPPTPVFHSSHPLFVPEEPLSITVSPMPPDDPYHDHHRWTNQQLERLEDANSSYLPSPRNRSESISSSNDNNQQQEQNTDTGGGDQVALVNNQISAVYDEFRTRHRRLLESEVFHFHPDVSAQQIFVFDLVRLMLMIGARSDYRAVFGIMNRRYGPDSQLLDWCLFSPFFSDGIDRLIQYVHRENTDQNSDEYKAASDIIALFSQFTNR